MNKPFSIYLDLVRFTAACLVYLAHSNRRLLMVDMPPAAAFGHTAVVVFFVLSGFVIAYVTDQKEKDWASYAASRLSRVYSVAVPTLLLTVLLDAIGRPLFPALYTYPFDQFALRILGSLLMLNEAWFISIGIFSNTPYWSIAYESWYYIIFGVAMFVPKPWRALALLGCGLIIGPQILLLLPVWWAGVGLYRWRWLAQTSQAFCWCLVVLSVLGIIGYHELAIYKAQARWTEQLLGEPLYQKLGTANLFLVDYVLALLVFCNFAGMRGIADSLAPLLLRIERPVRWLAGYTFTLYMLHQPLLLFWAAVIRGRPETPLYWIEITVLTALSVVAVGHVTESRRHALRQVIEAQLLRAQLRWRSRPGANAAC